MNKQHLLNLALLVGLSAFGTNAQAQTSINAASNRAVIQGNVFDYSIGEMTLIHTEKTGSLIVTQGYLQPSTQNPSSTTHLTTGTELTMRVYPNPTQNVLHIESFESEKGKVTLELFDATGKVVVRRDENLNEGVNKYTVDFSSFAAGPYFLLIKKTNSIESNAMYSFKVQKTN